MVLPTRGEGYNLPAAEAMASGLPVITSRSAGASEMISEGESGLLLDNPGDPHELSQKIKILLTDEANRKQIGKSARAAASIYNWSHVAEDTLQLYYRSLGHEQPVSVKPIP